MLTKLAGSMVLQGAICAYAWLAVHSRASGRRVAYLIPPMSRLKLLMPWYAQGSLLPPRPVYLLVSR